MRKILLLSLLFSQNLFAENTITLQSDAIKVLRSHTSLHAIQPARNNMLVKISGLEGGCTEGVFFPENNQATVSLMLAARLSKQDILIGYEPSVRSPWRDTRYCALTFFDIL